MFIDPCKQNDKICENGDNNKSGNDIINPVKEVQSHDPDQYQMKKDMEDMNILHVYHLPAIKIWPKRLAGESLRPVFPNKH